MTLTRPNGDEVVGVLVHHGGIVYCASPDAVRAAAKAYPGNDAGLLADALIAAHHPSLGNERSVCVSDLLSDEAIEAVMVAVSEHFGACANSTAEGIILTLVDVSTGTGGGT